MIDNRPIDLDIWRIAVLLVKRHGRAAAIVAQRADECLAAGDTEGQRIWKETVEATLELLRIERRDGGSIN